MKQFGSSCHITFNIIPPGKVLFHRILKRLKREETRKKYHTFKFYCYFSLKAVIDSCFIPLPAKTTPL